MGSKSTLRLMRTLGPSLGSLAQSTWSLLSNALAGFFDDNKDDDKKPKRMSSRLNQEHFKNQEEI
ncbi:hypothetical protein GmHk_14G041535 [Glycine max]|nr:hypothetical protein GmHk_14G041535 [Glycine max]